MNQCTDQLHSLTRTTPEVPAAALRFLDVMMGGFESDEEIELKVAIPADWHDQEVQAFVFLNEGGRWVERESRVEREGERLRLALPGGRLVHVAVALVPQYQSAPL
ncbi:MAG: hypothetical protein ACK4HB_02150 [Candidatus Bipolaricaulia bacterium]